MSQDKTAIDLLTLVMDQCEADFKAIHSEICKLQGLDPVTHDWPEWSTIANTKRWFDEIRTSLRENPMKVHFTNEWLRAKIEQDGDDEP